MVRGSSFLNHNNRGEKNIVKYSCLKHPPNSLQRENLNIDMVDTKIKKGAHYATFKGPK